jgi:hypothetical protein
MFLRGISHRLAPIVLMMALAVPTLWGCAPPRTTIVRVNPPAPLMEVRTAPPGRGYVWVKGHWRWMGHRYVWIHGHWLRRPRGHAVWVSGHWVRRGGGWIWISGHWKG